MMKSLIYSITLLAVAASHEAKSATTIEFGSLYGYDRDQYPTRVLDGGDNPLGTDLENIELWFVCLDQHADDPGGIDPYVWEYTVGTNTDLMTGGVWDTIPDPAARQMITGAITNMFLNNQTAIYADLTSLGGSHDEAGSAMQLAAWKIVHTYADGLWTNEWNASAVAAVISASQGDSNPIPMDSLTADFLYSSLVPNSNATGRVFFGTPAGDTDPNFQNVLLFAPYAIPEPSGITLLGASGLVILLARRRRA